MEVILIANSKGGTAKTATSLCLANCLSALGYRVLAIDTDPTAHFSAAALQAEPNNVLYDVFRGNCALADAIYPGAGYDVLPTVPSDTGAAAGSKSYLVSDDKDLEGLFASISKKPEADQFLRAVIYDPEAALEQKYDFIILDSPPSQKSTIVANDIVAADSILITCEPNSASSDGLRMLLSSIFQHKEAKIDGVVMTRFSDGWEDRRKTMENFLADAHDAGLYIYNTKFWVSPSIEKSMNRCRPILDFIYQGTGASDAMNFTLEFLSRRGMKPKKQYPGVFVDETGNYIFRKNGDPFYVCAIENGRAGIQTRYFRSTMPDDPDWVSAIGKTIFFHKKELKQ